MEMSLEIAGRSLNPAGVQRAEEAHGLDRGLLDAIYHLEKNELQVGIECDICQFPHERDPEPLTPKRWIDHDANFANVTASVASMSKQNRVSDYAPIIECQKGKRSIVIQVLSPTVDDGSRRHILLEQEALVFRGSKEEAQQTVGIAGRHGADLHGLAVMQA
jgi:hypothetical protein